MIGSCDCCNRQNVPVSNGIACGIETTACYVCRGGEPDPYGEMHTEPCPECGGDGGWEYPVSHDPFRDTIKYAQMECRACGGSGIVDIEHYPVELEDLQEFVS